MLIQTGSLEEYNINMEKILKVLHSHASDTSDKNALRREIAGKARETLVNPEMAGQLLHDLKGDDEINQR